MEQPPYSSLSVYGNANTASPKIHPNHTITEPSSTKRKRSPPTTTPPHAHKEKPPTCSPENVYTSGSRPKKREEKRLRLFRRKPPQSFLDRLNRVRTQRMFLVDRVRSLSLDGAHEEEIFDIAGSTGNLYQVTISKQPRCTCPDNRKGNQCKHLIYVLHIILKAPEHLVYQLALLSTELATIFAGAPVTPQSCPDAVGKTVEIDTGGHRKPIEGDCPVCVMEFDVSDTTEEIIWCRAACGNNIHRRCFEQWAKSKPGGAVRCVYCRTLWKGDEDSVRRIGKGGMRNEEGYVNVGTELGLSVERNMDSYHQPWVRRHFGDRGF